MPVLQRIALVCFGLILSAPAAVQAGERAGSLRTSEAGKGVQPAGASRLTPCGPELLLRERAGMAQTPRANEDAERLALRLTADLVAKESDYRRIARDLAAIRGAVKGDGGAKGAFADFGTHALIVGLSPKAMKALKAGSYKGLDCLNTVYGLRQHKVLKSLDMVLLRFRGLFHPERLAEAYQKHPDVVFANPNGQMGGGDNIRLCNADVGGSHRYVFTRGSGDCPAGCIRWVHRGYEVSEAGVVTPLKPHWKQESGKHSSARPSWAEPSCFRRYR